MSETKRGNWLVRWLRRGAVAALLLCLVVAGLLVSGMPQRLLVGTAVSKALKARVTLSGLSLYDKVRIDRLTAYPEGSPEAGGTPSLDVTGFEADYALSAPDKRNITAVRIASLDMQRELRGAEKAAASSSPDSSPRRPARGARRLDADRFVPKSLGIDSLNFAGKGSTVGYGVGALRVDAAINSRKDFSADLKGENVEAFWWAGTPDAMRKAAGTLDIHAEKHGADMALDPLKASFPGWLDLAGVVRVEKKDGGVQCDVNLEKAVFQDVDLSGADARELPLPFAFKRLDLSGTRIQGPAEANLKMLKLLVPEISVSLAAEGLRLGAKGREFYDGPLMLSLTGQPGGLNLALEASLNRGQKIHAALSGPMTDILNTVSIAGWSRDDLLAVIPEPARAAVAATPLAGLDSVEVEAHAKLLTLEYQASAKPLLSTSQVPVEFRLKGEVPLLTARRSDNRSAAVLKNYVQTLTARVADGVLTVEKGADNKPPLTARWTATLENLSPAQWVQSLFGLALPAELAGPLAGTMDIQADNNLETFEVAVNLSQGLALNAASLRPLVEMLGARAADRAALEKAMTQLDGKDGAAPFTGGTLRFKRAEGQISGEATLTNGALELVLPVAL